MLRSKLGLLGLCAIVLGVMAMSASAAQGATLSWLVLNAAKTTSTNLKAALVAEKDSEHLTMLTEIIGLKVSITCTNFALTNAFIEPVDKLSNGGKVTFTGCEAYEGWVILGTALGCNVKSAGQPVGTLATNNGKGLLELHSNGEVLTKIEPEEAGGAFVTILTSGCSLPESNPVRGVLYAKDALGQATTHAVKHLIVEGPLTALYVGAHSAKKLEVTKLHGSAWVKLGQTPGGTDHTGLEFAALDTP